MKDIVAGLVVLLIVYLVFHGHHARRRWQENEHEPLHRRIWVSLPGPFGTRVEKRL